MRKHKAEFWLSAAADDPAACRREWRAGEHGMALLATGRMWDALILPKALARAVLDELTGMPHSATGPAMLDRLRGRITLLLPLQPLTRWAGAGVRHLTVGSWIAVPSPYRKGGPLLWLTPPDDAGTLFPAAAIEGALDRAVRGSRSQHWWHHRKPGSIG